MTQFTTTIRRFDRNKEKTGWSFIEISAVLARKLRPDTKVSFRVKGKLDQYSFEKLALIPIGDGNYILPINGRIRKAIGKKQGDKVTVALELDERKLTLSRDLLSCLGDDPPAQAFFKTLSDSHQQYFSKWIESAKTLPTRTKRIVMAVVALGKKQDYPAMMQANKGQ